MNGVVSIKGSTAKQEVNSPHSPSKPLKAPQSLSQPVLLAGLHKQESAVSKTGYLKECQRLSIIQTDVPMRCHLKHFCMLFVYLHMHCAPINGVIWSVWFDWFGGLGMLCFLSGDMVLSEALNNERI